MSEDNTNNEQNNESLPDFNNPKVQEAINKLVEDRVAKETQGLVQNKEEILSEKKALQTKLREIETKYGDDLSRFDQLLEEEKKRKEAEMTLEERLHSQYSAEKKQLTDMWKQKEEEYSKTMKAKDSALEKYLIQSQLQSEISSAGGFEHMLTPALASQLKVVESNGDYKVMVVDGDTPRLRLDGSPMEITDLVAQYKADERWAPAFRSSGATGGQASGNKESSGSGGAKARSEMSFKERSDYIAKHGQESYFALPE